MTDWSGFAGRTGRTFASSQGWWPPRPTAPVGPGGRRPPNVVVVMVDDLGYSDVGCFGGEIPTPNVDALAGRGLRLANFHTTPMCSPTRAALLTGLDAHDAGMGSVPHSDAGFPGYAMELAVDAPTIAEVLRDSGWATFCVGKWHLTKDSEQHSGGLRRSWPCGRGFDRFYGVLDAFTNLHHPHRIVEDNHAVEIDEYPDGYFLTDDLTDRAIGMLNALHADEPDKPFFLYYAFPAVHAPLHARADDIEQRRGQYDVGWDVLRAQRFERQQSLGIVEQDVACAPRNSEEGDDVEAWDDLPEEHKRLFARHMEVFAAAVHDVDRQVGRLLDAIARLGRLEDTLVVFCSDNGPSREGERSGTSAYYVHLLQGEDVTADLARIDELGGPTTTAHYPRGWAMLGATPFRLYKLNTHAGGHTVPFVVSWPAGLPGDGGLRRQYAHVTDLYPTLLEACGVERPATWHGQPVRPLAGSSLLPVLADADAASVHRRQLYENLGHRGYYRDGWEVVTRHRPLTPFDDEEWELYDLVADPTELNDLSGAEPDLRAELAAEWEAAARAGQVYPLDEGSSVKYLVRPPWTARYAQPVNLVAGTPTLERWRSLQLVWFRSVSFTAHLDAISAVDRGHLVAHGDQGGGYSLHVLDGEAVFVHNDGRGRMRSVSGGAVPPGASTVAVELTAREGHVWDARVLVDGTPGEMLEDLPMLYGMAPFEGIDVGVDRRSPVSWPLYERFGCFRFTGALRHVRVEPGPLAPDAPENLLPVLREMGARFG